jgi:uncharacterized membrane protein
MNSKKQQLGVVLIFVMICLVALLATISLSVDLGRLFLVARQAQNISDTTSLAAIPDLQKPDPLTPDCVPLNGWARVKPVARMSLSQSPIVGVASIPDTATFNQGIFTSAGYDLSGMGGTIISSNPAGSTMQVEVLRGLICYNDSDPKQYWRGLDDEAENYCIANAIQTTVTVSGIKYFFAPLIGMLESQSVSRTSRSHVRQSGALSCGDPTCANYFVSGSFNPSLAKGGDLLPFACPTPGGVIATHTPTATPTEITGEPTNTPTATATATNTATSIPTSTPTTIIIIPTNTPTNVPTSTPTAVPTNTPTQVPTSTPTTIPTSTPTTETGNLGSTGRLGSVSSDTGVTLGTEGTTGTTGTEGTTGTVGTTGIEDGSTGRTGSLGGGGFEG